MRISLRAVGIRAEFQLPLYTVSLADGLSATCDPDNLFALNVELTHLGRPLCEFELEEFYSGVERRQMVEVVDLGDRKMFLVPRSDSEAATRSFTKALLEIARSERISALSFTQFSFHRGSLPGNHCKWILETMLEHDATYGPYRLWFEVSEEHFLALHQIRASLD